MTPGRRNVRAVLPKQNSPGRKVPGASSLISLSLFGAPAQHTLKQTWAPVSFAAEMFVGTVAVMGDVRRTGHTLLLPAHRHPP